MATKLFSRLEYQDTDQFVYGSAKHPVQFTNGMVVGGGSVYPELNFTLPTMAVNSETMPEVLKQYREITDGACKRAHELFVPGMVIEIELLPPATYNPKWGIEITETVRTIMREYEDKFGLKSLLRLTPVDIREDKLSPHMWHGSHWDFVMQTFEGTAKAGADMLAIESIGGKDIHDDALMYGEIDKCLFALGVLGCRDMERLWGEIAAIAERTGTVASGDTACAFANTAMVLAERGMLPKVFAAVVRVMTAVRSMVAIEQGAVGPHKDCGYEGVYVKAITGTPISTEGKSSACAHSSPVGNIAACVADLWSNESVQNIKLLGGMAPTVSMEQLAYDCRLMNIAASKGMEKALEMRDWLSESDSKYDPQAYILRPDVVVEISKSIVNEDGHFKRTKAAALKTIEVLRRAMKNQEVLVPEREVTWLDSMEQQLESVSDDEAEFTDMMTKANQSERFVPAKYDLAV